MKELKLTIELIPESCWYNNLRTLLGQEKWRGIRRDALYKAGNKCQICEEETDDLHCHEIWDYDDKKHIQTLKGFIILCYMCHSIKHIGFAFMRLWSEMNPKEIENGLIRHFMKINDCGKGVFVSHLMEIGKQQGERNKYSWTTVMDNFLPKKINVPKRTVYIDGKIYKGGKAYARNVK